MRGKEICDLIIDVYLWITPAYAGKSRAVKMQYPDYTDHPRLCGEKNSSICLVNFSTGSPPPMRGKGGNAASLQFDYRITPAYAGKSRSL